jgi:Flp pilus assembly protein TadG
MDFKDAIRRQANGAGRGCAARLRALLRRGRPQAAAEDGSRDAAKGEDGQALIETAVSLPVLFALLFCFMELCLAFYSYDMISESAREGTRYAMLLSSTCTNSSGASCTATAAQVNTYVPGLGWPNLACGTMTVSTTYKTPAGGVGTNIVSNFVVVQITYVFPITMPFVPKNSITLKSTSQMPIIQ